MNGSRRFIARAIRTESSGFTNISSAGSPNRFPSRFASPTSGIGRSYAASRQGDRELTESDLSIFASDHWNFNVRGFNPGGNHGSFLRISTHSVLMAAGGGVPAGLEIDRPYDSLSLVPTLLSLLGRSLWRDPTPAR